LYTKNIYPNWQKRAVPSLIDDVSLGPGFLGLEEAEKRKEFLFQ